MPKTQKQNAPRKRKTEAWEPKKPVLLLRTCNADMTSYGGFQWPESGFVEAKDWDPRPVCGGGLHGLLWGKGSVSYLNVDSPKWVVFLADESEVVEIDCDKHKAKRGNVLFVGKKDDAVTFLYSHPLYPSRNDVGNYGSATAGNYGSATAGDGGSATAGYRGSATAGDGGSATAGYRGSATAGNYGSATAGDGGSATAGNGGTLIILHWNGKRYKTKVAQVKDEDGDGQLKPNTKYRLNARGEFEEVQ